MERWKFIRTAGYSAAAACITTHLSENKSDIPDPGSTITVGNADEILNPNPAVKKMLDIAAG